MTEIAIVGMGIAVPGAGHPSEFWQLLHAGQPQVSDPDADYRIDSFWSADPDAEDRSYARASGFLTGLAPHPRLAAELAAGRFDGTAREAIFLRHCLLHAVDGVTIRDGDRGHCVIGGTDVTSRPLDEAVVIESAAHQLSVRLQSDPAAAATQRRRLRALLQEHFGHSAPPSARLRPDQVVRSAVDGLVPGGAAVTVVDAACASSLYAIGLGAAHLLAGDCEVAYCGGMSGVAPRYNVGFAKLGGLSRSGRLRVFDERADGTLFSEGAAVVVLKTLDRARADGDPVLGVLAGFGASSDGRGKAIYAPNPLGQSLCIERAQRAAGIDASRVDWVVAHATGTVAGDAAELTSLAATAPPGGRLTVSNKPVIGHTGWTSGAVSVIHALLALHHGEIPAQHGYTTAPPGSLIGTRVEVPVLTTPWDRHDDRPRAVGVSSFGFGGANAHVVITEAGARRAAPSALPLQPDPVVLVAWAAHLPGEPSRAEVERMLATGGWTCPRDFGRYEPPPFDEVRLPAGTVRSTDRGQLMALHLAAMLIDEYGELWAPVRDTTGVIAARSGPQPLAVGNLLRCYAADLEGLFADDDAKTWAAVLDDVRAETPPTRKDTLPGIFPNILAARLANRHDLHGPAMLVDSGPTSGATALNTAALHLATGELDLALVLAVNAAVPAGLEHVTGAAPDGNAEGAFLVALARSSTARRQGWRALAEVPRGAGGPTGRDTGGTTFLAADPIVSLLATMAQSSS
ncbi:beta-ketoacyl synthase N-terminal-like domain-containing protein [Dactylosporangium sp. NPDC048998]|uniref:beta-ketoacyl synthase N-terminal-like domain-containing protein n=1 Tax=Dactylosporangium sp. NPDC048998 TaxID=3363976 RepID=UPI00371EC6A9